MSTQAQPAEADEPTLTEAEKRTRVAFASLAFILLSAIILSLVYLALFGSVITFVTYFWLLKHVEVVLLSLTAFVTPIIAVVAGVIVFQESFTLQMLGGSVLVLAGIVVANSTDLVVLIKRGRAVLWD